MSQGDDLIETSLYTSAIEELQLRQDMVTKKEFVLTIVHGDLQDRKRSFETLAVDGSQLLMVR